MMDKKAFLRKKISDSTIRRLSIYLRTLIILDKGGVITISSKKLAEIEGFTSAQIRKDFSYFGSFGRRGLGYNVKVLKKKIAEILGTNKKWNVILIGMGHLGSALMNYEEFKSRGFYITKIFDKDPKLSEKKFKGMTVFNVNQLEKKVDPRSESLAILTIPPQDVQSLIERLNLIGIKGVLYFASRTVTVPRSMIVRNEDTTIELETLTYHITNRTDRPVKPI